MASLDFSEFLLHRASGRTFAGADEMGKKSFVPFSNIPCIAAIKSQLVSTAAGIETSSGTNLTLMIEHKSLFTPDSEVTIFGQTTTVINLEAYHGEDFLPETIVVYLR